MGASVTPVEPSKPRLDSVDLLRGVVMVVMALDHVRDFFSNRTFHDPTDLATTTWAIFLTRWITHYCAPTFIFLAGTGAFLSRARGKSRPELAWFLFTRGLWCAFLEVTVIHAFWYFDYDFRHYAGDVFWAIGWSMIVLSWLIYLPTSLVTLFGVAMIVLHNSLDGLSAEQAHLPGWLWMILHSPGQNPVAGSVTFATSYCLIPWSGVMAAGYGFGRLLQLEPSARRKSLLHLGATLTLAFVIVRLANGYGDPRPWAEQPREGFSFLSFLNCTKYPPSLLYLLMTLGPAILFLAVFDQVTGPLTQPFVIFGRVPMFYYLLHLPLIHGVAVLYYWTRLQFAPLPREESGEYSPRVVVEAFGFDLPGVYLVWIAVVLALYPACRWFAGVKQRRRDAWLSYF